MKLATSPKIGIMYTLSCGTCGQNVCDGPFVEEAASFSDDYELGDTMSSDPSTDCNKFPDNPRLIRQCPGQPSRSVVLCALLLDSVPASHLQQRTLR